MADFKDQVATYKGGPAPRLAEELSYEPGTMIVSYLTYMDVRQGNIDGSNRREAKRMVKFNYPETYWDNKGICFTSDKMYIGMSPEVCRYMSMKLNEAGHTVFGDTSMHKLLEKGAVYETIRKAISAVLDDKKYGFGRDRAHFRVAVMNMYLVVGLLIHATPKLYELVQDVKDAGDDDPMAVTHTNAEWLAKIETCRFRDLFRRASIKLMNAIDTAKGRKPIELLTPDEPARTFSTSIMLGLFKDSAKLKDENRQTVNKYQKPIALFSKHLKMAATDGTTIVDVTAGTGTTAVRDGPDDHSVAHRNLKTVLIDNHKTQIAGMKSRMKSWIKEKPWDETLRLRPDDFEKWPGLPLPMTLEEQREELIAAEKRRHKAARRRGDYLVEGSVYDDDDDDDDE
eukprot:jgi/Tetstr1/433448/TSEL_022722.t1